jgi:hypothetical protein
VRGPGGAPPAGSRGRRCTGRSRRLQRRRRVGQGSSSWQRGGAAPATPTPNTPRPPPQVLTLAGELLANAEVLLRDGLHTAEIADGYQRASDKVCVCVCVWWCACGAGGGGHVWLWCCVTPLRVGETVVASGATQRTQTCTRCARPSTHPFRCCCFVSVCVCVCVCARLSTGAAGAGDPGAARHRPARCQGQGGGASRARGWPVCGAQRAPPVPRPWRPSSTNHQRLSQSRD